MEMAALRSRAILFIDDIHNLVPAAGQVRAERGARGAGGHIHNLVPAAGQVCVGQGREGRCRPGSGSSVPGGFCAQWLLCPVALVD